MRGAVAAVCLLLIGGCTPTPRVVVAAGTTVVDSGLIDLVVDVYEAEHSGVELSVVGDATARILELGRRGVADVLITHAPEAERQFLATQETSRYAAVFESRFVLVGPATQAAELSGLSVPDALRVIARRELTFVTRADGSGTHAAELELWGAAGVSPVGRPWYIETGQGMGLTLQVTDQKGGFTLAELGAFRSAEGVLSIVQVETADDPRLRNPYHATVPTGAAALSEAERFVDWLIFPEGKAAVSAANRTLYGSEEIYRLP